MAASKYQPFFSRKNYVSAAKELSVIYTGSQEQLYFLRSKTFTAELHGYEVTRNVVINIPAAILCYCKYLSK